MTPKKPPHPALVLSTLTITAISIASIFWMLAQIQFQVMPS